MKRKTRFQAATAYAKGVELYGTAPLQSGFYIQRAFIDGAKWQQNRSNKRRRK